MDSNDKDEEISRGARDYYPHSSRTDNSRGTPGRASLGGPEIVMDLAGSKPVMVDSYLTKFDSVMCPSPIVDHVVHALDMETTEVQELVTQRSTARSFITDKTTPGRNDTHRSQLTTGRQSRKSRRGGDYGLSVITWEEFLESPKGFNELFYLERGNVITFDPEEVNVFFQDSLMMQPTLGSPDDDDGKSWTVYIESLNHLKQVRLWMLERVSVISVVIKNNKSTTKLGKIAPCLIAINPSDTSIRAKLELAFEQSWESVLARRKYCIEIDLSTCIEEWMLTSFRIKCQVKATKVFITNGDEYSAPDIGQRGWKIACYPCLSVQRLLYKMQRRANYDDYLVKFENEPVSICTGSKLLQMYSTGPSAGKRPGLKKSVSIKVTASTQTLTDRNSPTEPDSLVEDISSNAYFNDAFDDRGEDREELSTPTPRAGSLHEDNIVPRPGSRMAGDYSSRTYVRSDIHMRSILESPAPSLLDESFEKENTRPIGVIETVTAAQNLPNLTDDVHHTKFSEPVQRASMSSSIVHTISSGRFESTLASPGRVENMNKANPVNYRIEPHSNTVKESQSPEDKINVKNKKRIGKILKEILSSNEGNKVNHVSETTVESLDPTRLIVVGSESSRKESEETNKKITDSIQEMLPSKENTFSNGFDEDATSSVSEIITPRKNKNKITPKTFLVEPQVTNFFPNGRKYGRVRHAFSDVDQDEDEYTDYEPDSIMSDNIAVNSPRFKAVKKTSKTPINKIAVISDLDSDLEVFDMDNEELKLPGKEAVVHSTPRQKQLPKVPNPNLIRGPRGQRNSRRRYLALNSLRKKTRVVGIQPQEPRR